MTLLVLSTELLQNTNKNVMSVLHFHPIAPKRSVFLCLITVVWMIWTQ